MLGRIIFFILAIGRQIGKLYVILLFFTFCVILIVFDLFAFVCLVFRFESAHSTLKGWLGSSTGGFDTIWTKIHAALEGQFQGLMAEFESSRIRSLHMTAHHCFVILRSKVSHLALKKINDEIERKNLCGRDP